MGDTIPLARWDYRAALALALAAVILGILSFRVELAIDGDAAEYVVLGQALASGSGYRQMAEPDTPQEYKRPPGYPALVALSRLAFGDSILPLQLLSLGCIALSASVAYLLLRQSCPSRILCVGATVLFVANKETLAQASAIGADAIFSAGALVALLLLQRHLTRDRNGPWVGIVSGLAVAVLTYVRPSAIVLLPAMAAGLVSRRRFGSAGSMVLVTVALLAPWGLTQREAARHGSYTHIGGALSSLEATAEGSGSGRRMLPGPIGALTKRIATNLGGYTLKIGQILLARPDSLSLRPPPIVDAQAQVALALDSVSRASERPVTEAAPGTRPRARLQRLARYVLGIATLLGGVLMAMRRVNLGHWYVLFTFALLLVMPYKVTRYLVPILPLLALYLLWLITRPLPPVGATCVVCGVCLLSVLLTVPALTQRSLWNVAHRGTTVTDARRYGLDGMDTRNYVRALEWLSANAPGDAVIACRKPHGAFLVTGRRTTRRPMWLRTPQYVPETLANLSRCGPVYIIDDAFGDRFPVPPELGVRPTIRENLSAFEMVFRLPNPETTVWRVAAPELLTAPEPHSETRG